MSVVTLSMKTNRKWNESVNNNDNNNNNYEYVTSVLLRGLEMYSEFEYILMNLFTPSIWLQSADKAYERVRCGGILKREDQKDVIVLSLIKMLCLTWSKKKKTPKWFDIYIIHLRIQPCNYFCYNIASNCKDSTWHEQRRCEIRMFECQIR